jgi:hypothetical protein
MSEDYHMRASLTSPTAIGARVKFALDDLGRSQKRCQMLLHEGCGDASRFLRSGLVAEDTELNPLALARIQPIVRFEARSLAQKVYEDVLDSIVDLIAVLRIESIPPDYCVHGFPLCIFLLIINSKSPE